MSWATAVNFAAINEFLHRLSHVVIHVFFVFFFPLLYYLQIIQHIPDTTYVSYQITLFI